MVTILDCIENILNLRESVTQQVCSTHLLRRAQGNWPHLPTAVQQWPTGELYRLIQPLLSQSHSISCNNPPPRPCPHIHAFSQASILGTRWALAPSSVHSVSLSSFKVSRLGHADGCCQPSKHRLLTEEVLYGGVKPEDYGEQSPGKRRGLHWLWERIMVLELFSPPKIGMKVGRILMEWRWSWEIHKGNTAHIWERHPHHPCSLWIVQLSYISFRPPSVSHV